MEQFSFVDAEFQHQHKPRKTRLGHLTERLGKPIPCQKLLELNRPHCSVSVHKFVERCLSDQIFDKTTILQLRHLLKEHNMETIFLDRVNPTSNNAGLNLVKGIINDTSFIETPSSPENKCNGGDPKMTSGKKVQTWHFGTKMHVATDEVTIVIYGLANKHDIVRVGVRSKLGQVFKPIKLDMDLLQNERLRHQKNAHNTTLFCS